MVRGSHHDGWRWPWGCHAGLSRQSICLGFSAGIFFARQVGLSVQRAIFPSLVMEMGNDEMIERVARAIYFRGDDQGDDAWNHCQPHWRELAREQARAAIRALRIPTEAMCQAGSDAHSVWGFGAADAAIVFPAMLDAALAQPTAPVGE